MDYKMFKFEVLVNAREVEPDVDFKIDGERLIFDFSRYNKTHPDDKLPNSNMSMNLKNAYARYVRAGESLEQIIEIMVVGQINMIKESEKMRTNWDMAKDAVYPRLLGGKLDIDISQGINKNKLAIIYNDNVEQMPEGTVLAYCIDMETSMIFVTNDILNEWGVTKDELHKTSIKNLRNNLKGFQKITISQPIKEVSPEAKDIFIVTTNDGYDSSKILYADLNKMAEDLGTDKLLISIPSRDLVMITAYNEKTLPVVSKMTIEDFFKAAHYSVSNIPFYWEKNDEKIKKISKETIIRAMMPAIALHYSQKHINELIDMRNMNNNEDDLRDFLRRR